MRKTSITKPKLKKEIVISEANDLAVVFDNGRASEFFLRHGDQLVGDIIWGQVDAVVPGIEAAFVDIGQDRNGFIHVADLPEMQTPRKQAAPTKPSVKVRERILVQIAKAPTGTKGARLTGRITIPGRFLVLVPHDNRVSISRRITDGRERDRLRDLTLRLKDPGHGLIVRTEAIGRSEEELRQDIEELIEIWADILHQVQFVEPPALLHRDSDLIHRVLRDALTGDVARIIVDTHTGYHKAREILQGWMPEVADQVVLHEGAQSIMEKYKIGEELDAAISPKVWLPSGGYLVLEHTEALTVVDVNSGRLTQSKSLAETVLRTNIEAAAEIARQLRLRDIGGIIVIDFISMDDAKDRQKVYQAFVEALKQDKSRPQVTNFSEHGLIEVSRRRQGQNLLEQLTLPCDVCNGTGRKKASHLLSETPGHEAFRHGRMEEEAAEIADEMEGDEEDLGLDLGEAGGAASGEAGDAGQRRRRRRRRRGGRGRGEGGGVGPIFTAPGDEMVVEEAGFEEERVAVVHAPRGGREGREARPPREERPRPVREAAPVAVEDDGFGLVEEVDLFGEAEPRGAVREERRGDRDRGDRGRDRGRGGRDGGRERFGDRGGRDRDRAGDRGGRERDRFGERGGRERPAERPFVPAAESAGPLQVTAPAPRVRRVERLTPPGEVAAAPAVAATPAPARPAAPARPTPAPAPAPAVAVVAPAPRVEPKRAPARPLPVPEEVAETGVSGVFVLKKKAAARPSLDDLLGGAVEEAPVKAARKPAAAKAQPEVAEVAPTKVRTTRKVAAAVVDEPEAPKKATRAARKPAEASEAAAEPAKDKGRKAAAPAAEKPAAKAKAAPAETPAVKAKATAEKAPTKAKVAPAEKPAAKAKAAPAEKPASKAKAAPAEKPASKAKATAEKPAKAASARKAPVKAGT
jgi:ribonuclease E